MPCRCSQRLKDVPQTRELLDRERLIRVLFQNDSQFKNFQMFPSFVLSFLRVGVLLW